MEGRNMVVRWLAPVAALAALGCSGKSQRGFSAGRESDGGNAGTGQSGVAGAGGQAASSGDAGMGTPSLCTPGAQRCTGERRETCSAEGTWNVTDFVCAASVAVSDEFGNYCVTKKDGTYRCSGKAVGELPRDRYVRVQLGGYGDAGNDVDSALPVFGLTEDGRLVARGFDLPLGLPPATSFRATNMWGGGSICPLFSNGAFSIIREAQVDHPGIEPIVTDEGPFFRAFCVWEGYAVGVRADGSGWSRSGTPVLPGGDWVELALSLGVFCGIRASGEVLCDEGLLCDSTAISEYALCQPPVFPPGRYRALAATGGSVCALDEHGALLCKRLDGNDMPIPAGPYAFVDGGKTLVCAGRVDGSVACFRHGGDGWPSDIGDFVPEPTLGPEW
jgi:hypothetical protein